MKYNRSKMSLMEGSVLLVTMCVLAVAAISIASYLMLVQNQTASVARSQNWNNVIPVSEAGVEEGLALVNLGAPNIITSPMAWTNSVVSNGWSALIGGQTTLTRYLPGSSNYYTVTVSIPGPNGPPTITSVGVVPYYAAPWIFSSAQQPLLGMIGFRPLLAQVSQGNSGNVNIGRKLQAQTTQNPLFTAPVITRSNFNMNGKNTTVNSFDSSNPLYSTGGQYDPTPGKYKANGNVGTDSSIIGDINIGNGTIYGKVMTGPGTQQNSVQLGPHGTVGDVAFVNGGGSGIETGFWSGNFNVNIPDVTAPSLPGAITVLPPPVLGTVNLPAGNYVISPSDPNIGKPLNVIGNATVWVQGSYSPPTLTIGTNIGAKLVLYLGKTSGSGDSLSMAGNGTINSPGYSANLQLYGLPSLTSISLSGNAAFNGTIYAPEADVTGGGGGNNTMDSCGAMIVKSVTFTGHWNFHYDEALLHSGPTRGWIVTNWTELKYP